MSHGGPILARSLLGYCFNTGFRARMEQGLSKDEATKIRCTESAEVWIAGLKSCFNINPLLLCGFRLHDLIDFPALLKLLL